MSLVHKEWATPRPAGFVLVGAGVALIAAAAASYADPTAVAFIGIAAVLLLAFGVITLVRRPRLALLDGPTLVVKTLSGPIELTPDDVAKVSLLKTRRLAARGQQLLLDLTDERLLIFGRWDLGVPPSAVLDDLRAAGFPVED